MNWHTKANTKAKYKLVTNKQNEHAKNTFIWIF